jgi:molybdopterin-containing oxidoreductase family membrane subunit
VLSRRGHRRWFLLVLGCIAAMAFGVFCFLRQLEGGFIVTTHRNPGNGGAAWGMYIVFYVVLVGVSFAGITVASIARLFNVTALKPVTRLAELLTITALMGGALMIMADLGRPAVALINLPKLANPTSPFFGTFTLVVAGYLFSSIVYFFLAGRADAAMLARDPDRAFRVVYKIWASGYTGTPEEEKRHARVSVILALTILPMLITAHSTLGFIFGIQVGRPGWFSALQAPGFVIMAGVSGTGVLILLIIGLRRMFRLSIPDASIRWLGNFMWILGFIYLYFMIADELTATYGAALAERHVAHELTHGRYATLFAITVGSLLLGSFIPFLLYVGRRLRTPFAALFVRGKMAVRLVGLSALLVNVAAVLKRYLIVVPSQIEGTLLPLERGTYAPDMLEVGVVSGLIGMVLLMILLFGRLFPLVPSAHEITGQPRRDPPRAWATLAWLLFGAGLVTVGLLDAFRLLRPGEVDPSIPFAPVIFAAGVIVLFSAAIVYEVFPRAAPSLPAASGKED